MFCREVQRHSCPKRLDIGKSKGSGRSYQQIADTTRMRRKKNILQRRFFTLNKLKTQLADRKPF